MSIELICHGDEFSLLHGCAMNCVNNGGEWYTAPQALAILGDHVSNPALMGDAAFISMAEPERIVRLLDRLAAADALLRFMRTRFDAYMDDSDRAAIDAHLSENTHG